MKVYLIGAGPGDAGLLTLKGRDALAGADVVVYDALANEALLDHVRPDAEKIYVGKVAGNHALPQDQINALLVAKAREGKVVARLKGGDPYIFGRGGEEAEELVAAGVPFEEVPGISSTVAAPAYAGIPLTHRDFASSVTIITGHENPDKPGSVHNWAALAASAATLVFVMGMKNLPDIVRNLLAAGMDPATPAALVYRGTTPAQRSLAAPLAELPQAAAAAAFTNPSVIVVGKVAGLRGTLNWFENRPLFGRRIVVTRAREQASGLAQSLTSLGAEVIQCPTIEIRPLEDYAALDAALANLAEYHWIIFTSVNGVRHFWQRLAVVGKDSRALGGCRVAAIGPATAEALRGRGIAPDFVPQRYVAEGVLEGLLAREGGAVAGKRFLLPRAAKAREVLPEELRKAGAVVDVLPAYVTVPADHNREAVLRCLEEGHLDCVTFGSSSTVENFLALIPAATLKAHPEVQLAAIGPVTARTLAAHGLACRIQPEEYTIPALVAALQTHFARSARA
ncbi:uroporphyrinogen-III C-methyltransferase [Desulfovibrio legallii]|mgnify:CR=1 FL=1|uniref:uroporphyrinogen-III C-methyltransferase n=4 Tax=Desulfovibrio TaxID=872 RepID=A0A6H3F981_9BACT|nr:uroporphyrinogen-III C-methyltransferase [Desulfovibrio legallii]RHH24244.1 uroporphyrinogen-III C-methyltransferase [Desulfovibrio sp. AM18-2]TBH78407.1 uroporphyrinogen-III C-methyltransferase [Desulfovibrio legallii]CAI3218270.1 Uroporphyrinogen-III methyltransferase (EC / Uroporphyrinogen-III synthase (EC [Desulfovibrio diazotrophicus]